MTGVQTCALPISLRAAVTPDGRVRLTLELLTAMHEEGERRSRVDDASQPDPLTEMRDRFLTATGRMREAESRAETAERELEGAEREADEQRERRKRAEVERDAAHARAQEAERELAEMRADRDSWRQQCEDARSDALRYGRERDDLIAHARACLDPEIVSRDPAHARLAALVERIEGGR